MPTSHVEVHIRKGARLASAYLFAVSGQSREFRSVSGSFAATLESNDAGARVSEIACSVREFVTEKATREGYEILLRLVEPAPRDGTVYVALFDEVVRVAGGQGLRGESFPEYARDEQELKAVREKYRMR